MNLELYDLVKMRPEEKTVFFLRRHPIVFLGELLYIGVLAVLPLGVAFLIAKLWPSLMEGSMSVPSLILLVSAYYLVIWLFFISAFVDYYLDAWVLTTERILNIEQRGLFSRTVSELDLARVQDVTSEITGIIPSMLGYGFVYVQTAGEQERFIFEQISRPHEVRKRILELVEADQIREQRKAFEKKP
jgi:uncharacterized membrane protein YdbT with pleckstrin-like domain